MKKIRTTTTTTIIKGVSNWNCGYLVESTIYETIMPSDEQCICGQGWKYRRMKKKKQNKKQKLDDDDDDDDDIDDVDDDDDDDDDGINTNDNSAIN